MWWKYITSHCNILALLSIVFVPNANHYVPTGQVIYIFSFRAYLYAFFSCGFVIFLYIATNPFEHIVLHTYPGSVHFLPDHSVGISVSRVLMVFLYFAQFPFIYYCCIHFLFACQFFSQTRIRENR